MDKVKLKAKHRRRKRFSKHGNYYENTENNKLNVKYGCLQQWYYDYDLNTMNLTIL